MAFNVLHTFQKNRRFWMATILMVCMVSFVFCTGMKGDMAERLSNMFSGKGTAVFQIDGHTYGTQQLYELRTQRNLANKLLINCSDMAIKKLNKQFFELDKKQDAAPGKEAQARVERLTEIEALRQSIALKKSRPRYFDGGVKYDDLVEFTMWQAVADKLGIYIDEDHVKYLYYLEFYALRVPLDEQEINLVERETLRDFRDGNSALIRKAVTEEFRVRIAQEAVLLSQPLQMFGRQRQEGVGIKPVDPDKPDVIRAPITLAQLWDQFKQTRAEFDVTLLPLDVDKFMKNVQAEPTEEEKQAFFDKYKDKAADPSAEARGLQMPARVKIEYLMADPASPAYLESAKVVESLKLMDPFAPDVALSPLATASRYWAIQAQHRIDLQNQYDNLGRNDQQGNYTAAPFSERDCTTPILVWMAKRHPEAAAHLIGNTFLTPTDGLGALAGYVAWGATKEHKEEVDAAVQAELKRRAPLYATVFAASATGFPLDIVAPYMLLDLRPTGVPQFPLYAIPMNLPLEAVQKEIEEIFTRRAAEEKAQQNMQIARAALEKADGNDEKFKRELKKLEPDLKLTYGPADKAVAVNRYSADTAPELEPLRKAYLKYLDMVNLFEGRDVTPERLLKPADFYKLFFDSGETFAATTAYRAMPWPPRVKANAARLVRKADPRLINHLNIDPKANAEFLQQLRQLNPLAQAAPPPFDGLFNTAEKPILFWRTAERIPQRPSKYADIAKDIKAREADLITVQENLKKLAKLAPEVDALRKKENDLIAAKADAKEMDKVKTERLARRQMLMKLQTEAGGDLKTLSRRENDLKEDVADLKTVQRLVVEGWKFERARATEVLPTAKAVADALIKAGNQGINAQAAKLGATPFSISRLCTMYPEPSPDGGIEYGKPPLPKDKLVYPRADMVDQLVGLYDLDKPIKLGSDEIYKTNKELADLDELNRDLFERVKKTDNPRGNYVQILTNKPRSVYYVAFVSAPPDAKKREFVSALTNASSFGQGPRDRWVERIQQKDGRDYRKALVTSLKTMLHYEEVGADARKRFDDQVVGD